MTTAPPAVPPADRPRPAISFAAGSDRTTRLEVAVWPRVMRVSEVVEYTAYSLTLSRAWPGFSWAILAAASFRNSSYTSGSNSAAA